jgi:ectoine hydroxylase-related dioxygenase (phytanoyl-CoA dioxygenase family)
VNSIKEENNKPQERENGHKMGQVCDGCCKWMTTYQSSVLLLLPTENKHIHFTLQYPELLPNSYSSLHHLHRLILTARQCAPSPMHTPNPTHHDTPHYIYIYICLVTIFYVLNRFLHIRILCTAIYKPS